MTTCMGGGPSPVDPANALTASKDATRPEADPG